MSILLSHVPYGKILQPKNVHNGAWKWAYNNVIYLCFSLPVCGQDYTALTGVITSPNYPDNYPHQRECTWTITAPEGNQILLNVTNFSLENHPNCNYDFLEIRYKNIYFMLFHKPETVRLSGYNSLL